MPGVVARMALATYWTTIIGVKIPSLRWRSRDISNEYTQDPAGMIQGSFGVDFEISFTAVADQDEFPVWKIAHDLLKRRLLAFCDRLKYAL